MSEQVYVNFTRKKNETGRVETVENIYENTGAAQAKDSKTERDDGEAKRNVQTPSAGGEPGSRCLRWAALCLLLLCVVLLSTIAVLGFIYSSLTVENAQLRTSFGNLTAERNQLKKERDDVTAALSALERAINRPGWSYFKSSIYYVSTEAKTWRESRQDCAERGADLVIVNSKEEQDFVNMLRKCGITWIGLTGDAGDKTWKWVDGSQVTTGYWRWIGPIDTTNENCVVNLEGWISLDCNGPYVWICEKRI